MTTRTNFGLTPPRLAESTERHGLNAAALWTLTVSHPLDSRRVLKARFTHDVLNLSSGLTPPRLAESTERDKGSFPVFAEASGLTPPRLAESTESYLVQKRPLLFGGLTPPRLAESTESFCDECQLPRTTIGLTPPRLAESTERWQGREQGSCVHLVSHPLDSRRVLKDTCRQGASPARPTSHTPSTRRECDSRTSLINGSCAPTAPPSGWPGKCVGGREW